MVPWRAVFGDDRPVEVEIGPGRGDTLLAFATAAPATNFFAIERAPGAAAAIMAKAAGRGLRNLRVITGDARCIVAELVPDASVAAYHVYFPDPWPKRRHHARRRLVTDVFARELARTLVPDGALHLASDLQPLVEEYAAPLVRAGLTVVPGAIPPPRPVTPFERKYARERTYYLRFTRAEGVGLRLPSVDG